MCCTYLPTYLPVILPNLPVGKKKNGTVSTNRKSVSGTVSLSLRDQMFISKEKKNQEIIYQSSPEGCRQITNISVEERGERERREGVSEERGKRRGQI